MKITEQTIQMAKGDKVTLVMPTGEKMLVEFDNNPALSKNRPTVSLIQKNSFRVVRAFEVTSSFGMREYCP